MSVMYIRDKNGNLIPVPSLKGKSGKSAYAYAQEGGYMGTERQFTEALGKIPETISLGIASDGLIYIFINGTPVGTGIPQGTGGETGDLFGYIDENNTVVLKGELDGGTYSIKYEMENGDIIDIGNLVIDNNIYYSITKNLTNCTISNSITQAVGGNSYSATITANNGYELKSVTVTMGGNPVSVSGGVINIATVTGDIVITAVAEEIVINYTNLFVPSEATINKRLNSSKVAVDLNGYVIANFIDVSDKTPFTSTTKVYIKGASFTNDSNTKILTYKNAATTDYTTSYSMMNGSAVAVTDEGNGVISFSGASSNIASAFATDIKQMVLVLKVKDTALTTADIQNIVITIDEPIG